MAQGIQCSPPPDSTGDVWASLPIPMAGGPQAYTQTPAGSVAEIRAPMGACGPWSGITEGHVSPSTA